MRLNIRYTYENYCSTEKETKMTYIEVEDLNDEDNIFKSFYDALWMNRLRGLEEFYIVELDKTFIIDDDYTKLHNVIFEKEYNYRNWQNLDSDAISARHDYITAKERYDEFHFKKH